MKRALWIFLCLFVFSTAFAIAKEPKQGGTLIHARGGDPSGLDMGHETDGEATKVATNIFDYLVQFELGSLNIVPGLATHWESSPDGKSYVFHLRRDVIFHDGTPFNADAMVFSIQRQYDPEHPFHKVGGPWKFWDGFGMSKIVASVEKKDDYTIVFKLKEPNATFLALMAMPPMHAVSPSALKKYGEDFGRNPIGTGPFRFVEWVKDDRITLEANKDYWGGRPYLDKLIFKTIPDNSVRYMELKTGGIHVMDFPNPDDIPLMKKDKNLKILETQGQNVGYLAMHCEKKPFDNPKIRLAVNHAINRKAIIDNIYGGMGVVAKNPVAPGAVGYHEGIEEIPYDPVKAKQLLAEAGYPNGFETDLWAMPVPRPYNPNGRKVAEAMQADLAKVGIRAKIVSYEWGTYLEKVAKGEHQMALFGWSGNTGEAMDWLFFLLTIRSTKIPALNIAFWKNEEYSDLINKANITLDVDHRVELYKKAQEVFHKEMPWVLLAHSLEVVAAQAKVSGFRVDPNGQRRYHKTWLE